MPMKQVQNKCPGIQEGTICMMLRAATKCSAPKAAKAEATNAGPTAMSLAGLKESRFRAAISPARRKTIPARDGHRTRGEVTDLSFYDSAGHLWVPSYSTGSLGQSISQPSRSP